MPAKTAKAIFDRHLCLYQAFIIDSDSIERLMLEYNRLNQSVLTKKKRVHTYFAVIPLSRGKSGQWCYKTMIGNLVLTRFGIIKYTVMTCAQHALLHIFAQDWVSIGDWTI